VTTTVQADLKSENDQLRTRQLEMSARLARLETVERELNELRQLNSIKATRTDAPQLAETLYTGRDPSLTRSSSTRVPTPICKRDSRWWMRAACWGRLPAYSR
jgi:cell shape-determining protein MreC